MTYEEVKKLPKYVKLEGSSTCLRLRAWQIKEGVDKFDAEYYRDGGLWETGFKFVDGVMYTKTNYPHVKNKKLLKCTKVEWRISNGQYVSSMIKAYIKTTLHISV